MLVFGDISLILGRKYVCHPDELLGFFVSHLAQFQLVVLSHILYSRDAMPYLPHVRYPVRRILQASDEGVGGGITYRSR